MIGLKVEPLSENLGRGFKSFGKNAMDEPQSADLLEELAWSLNVAISLAEGLLRQTRRKVIRVIGKKHPRCAEKLGRTYGEGELVKEVELTREFFSEVKGRYMEQTDKVIEEMEGMIYGEAKIVSIVAPDARWGYSARGRSASGGKVHIGCDESELVTSVDVLSGNEN